MSHASDLPDVGYQQQRDDSSSPTFATQRQQHDSGVAALHAGQRSETEWDPEALGQALLTEGSEWSAVSNLDAFFTKVSERAGLTTCRWLATVPCDLTLSTAAFVFARC